MKMKSKSLRKKSVAILAGLAIAGTIGASAASLGGLGGEDLGADTGVVASCDTDGVTVGYTTAFSTPAGEHVVNSIELTNINAACDGQAFSLAVLGDPAVAGDPAVELQTEVGTIALVAGAQSIPATAGLTAKSVTGLAMSISGTTVTP